MPCVIMSIKALTMGSYATANAGSRNLMVLIMLCGGYLLDIFLVPRKAKKGWTIYASMERRLMHSHLKMFSQNLQSEKYVLAIIYFLTPPPLNDRLQLSNSLMKGGTYK